MLVPGITGISTRPRVSARGGVEKGCENNGASYKLRGEMKTGDGRTVAFSLLPVLRFSSTMPPPSR